MNLWPALPRAVAAYGLDGATLPMPDAPVDPPAWAHLLGTARDQRVTGLLVKAILDGALPTTAEQTDAAVHAHRAWMTAALALEATLVQTARLLQEAGIDHRTLKGSAVAHLDYPDTALRCFGDIDLLVRSAQFDDTVKLLVAADHRRKFPEPRPGFDRRFGKGSCLVSPGGHEIDLHRTLAMGPYGLQINLQDLWGRSSTFELAGLVLDALAPEERFLHACFHAVLGDNPPRLSSLRDVAQMHLARPLDVDLTLRLSSSWKADAVVTRAVRAAEELLGLRSDVPLARWASEFVTSQRDQQFLSVYTGATANYAAKSLAAVRAIPRMRDKVLFVFTLALPRRRYLEQRQERATRRWLRALVQVRGARRSR